MKCYLYSFITTPCQIKYSALKRQTDIKRDMAVNAAFHHISYAVSS